MRIAKVRSRVSFKNRLTQNLESYQYVQSTAQLSMRPDEMSDSIKTEHGNMPKYLQQPPLLRNHIQTPTSIVQEGTVVDCLPFLCGNISTNDQSSRYDDRGLLTLSREDHFNFLYEGLSEFSGGWVALDASRPWMLYWALLALHLMGEDVSHYREQVVKSLYVLQNKSGGYGGGQGHLSHLAGTYAAILSIALVGGEMAWSLTDRKAMWEWLGRLKQTDGGFRVCEGGEEDVRGSYCALVIISLLDLPWYLPMDSTARDAGMQTFGDGLGAYLSRCQTYEGGIAASPGNEAHGSYTFCVLACLCLLDEPHNMRAWIDVERLLEWMSARQYAPEGGFTGRTNKLVDGCYSHWLGGCWPLVQACLDGPSPVFATSSTQDDESHTSPYPPTNLYHEEGLARYILNCCQCETGGLRDKPSKPPDSYHTCYTLAGLSTTEHYHYYETSEDNSLFGSAFRWRAIRSTCRRSRDQSGTEDNGADENFEARCNLKALNPVFVIPHAKAENMRQWAMHQPNVI